MFLHESHLPQVLRPDEYRSQEQFERERERLFLPAWHLVGTLADLPRDGDFFTFELLDHPLLVWRKGESVQAFLNVCPHRFSRISGAVCGHAGERLKCQYHGWEFDETGTTRKIPDARSFKPMAQGELGLTAFRTETVGQLIFVNLSDDGPSLAEFLGPGYGIGEMLCSHDRIASFKLEIEIDANWKIKAENSLEGYHTGMIHPTTFGPPTPAERAYHELTPRWTTFATDDDPPNAWLRFLDRLTHRLARCRIDNEYKHYFYYPHLMFVKMRLFSWAEIIQPLSKDRTLIRTFGFCYGGRDRRKLRTRLLVRCLKQWQRRFVTKVAYEDAGILPEVHTGHRSPRHPSSGLISVREERCFHFQEYIRRMTLEDGSRIREDIQMPALT